MKKQKIRGLEDWKIGKDNGNGERRWIATQPTVARNDGRSGFTLVELVIVIAIVIILSVVSVPIYRGYTNNAKMSEGYALLGTILSAQKTYFSEYGNFLNVDNSSSKGVRYTSNEEVLGIDARGNKYFSLFRYAACGSACKYAGGALLIKPEELRTDSNKFIMKLIYDITSGQTVKDNTTDDALS